MADVKEELENFSTRLGNCEVCDANTSKYTCPRCEVKTCSIICVKIHKKELECNGVRDKTLYKPMHKFGNLDLLSDYRLLEEISRSVSKYRTDINKRWTRFQTALPIQLYKLKCAAFRRGVKLFFLPPNFTRHRENTTYYDWKKNKLYWRIEWVFLSSSEKKKFIDERINDSEKLGTTIAKYLTPKTLDPELNFYYSANYSGICLLLKAEKTTNRFYELDMHFSLRRNLNKKKIIEFPTIYVVLKHQKDEYELVDSDTETAEDKTEQNSRVNENTEVLKNNSVEPPLICL